MSNEFEDISVEVRFETDKAIRVYYLGKFVFLPKSQIERMDRVDDQATIRIPAWLYNKHWD